jgi:hypothetical protein
VNGTPEQQEAQRWPVFLSSTFRELESYRRVIEQRQKERLDLAERVRLLMLDSDEYSRVSQDAAKLSIRKVEECDLVILLLGKQLGSRSESGKSFTQLEFDAARKHGIPVIAFVLDDNAVGLNSPSVEPGERGHQQWWEEQQQRDISHAIGGQVTWVRPSELLHLANPEDLAHEFECHLRDWLEASAKPHRYLARDNGQFRFLINHDEPYHALKKNVLAKQTSIIFGASGLGKTTLLDALESDPDVQRMYALPALRRTPDLQLVLEVEDEKPSMEGFQREIEHALQEMDDEAEGRPLLFVVQISSIAQRSDNLSVPPSKRSIARLVKQLKRGLPKPDLGADVTIVFVVVEKDVASALETALDLHAPCVGVEPLEPDAAANLLLAGGGLHLDCDECQDLAPSVAEAAGCWPPLIWICARAFAHEGQPEAQHAYLRRVERAFEAVPFDENPTYATFRGQLKLLDESHLTLLDVFAVFLPKPFAISVAVLADLSGSEEDEVIEHLDLLMDRGYIEIVDLPAHLSAGEPAVPHYAIHPFFWTFLERRLTEDAQEWERRQRLHAKALEVLDTEVNRTFDEDLFYKGWGELENPVRQSLIANWIYQLAFLEKRTVAAEAFVRLYLKAHWWWGNYVPFQFCEFLNHLGNKAQGWSPNRQRKDPLEFVATRIRGIHGEYPKTGHFEGQPQRGAAERWRGVERKLTEIGELFNIPLDANVDTVLTWSKEIPQEDQLARDRQLDVAKLLHIFLAHCARGLYSEQPLDDPRLRSIEGHYECALSLAEGQDDGWNQPWILSELGDAEWAAAEERRRSDYRDEASFVEYEKRARECATLGRDLARTRAEENKEELDFEVLAQCERLLGETWWAADRAAAAEHFLRAIHYAHCFELWPAHQPDEYSLHFERHVRALVVRILRGMSADGTSSGEGDVGDGIPESLVERIASFVGKDPAMVWKEWQAARMRPLSGIDADELFSYILFEPEWGLEEQGPKGEARVGGYRLPPTHGIMGTNEWVRAVKHDQIDAFRREAKRSIRATESRDTDHRLVRLPDA